MFRTQAHLLAAACIALPCPALLAQEAGSQWNEHWTCGARIPVTRALVAAVASPESLALSGFAGSRYLPPFLAVRLAGAEHGALLLAKTRSGWKAFAIEAGASPFAAHVNSRHGAAFVFARITTGGPGPEHTVMRTRNTFRTVVCSVVPSPAGVDFPDVLDMADFNMSGNTGAIVGTVLNNATQKNVWYRSVTTDGGAHFGVPTPLPGKPKALRGSFLLSTDANLTTLIRDLQKSFP